MSDRDSMNREIKKNQLRRQIVSSSPQAGEDSQEVIKKALTKVRKRKIRIALVLFLVLLAGGIGVYEYFTLYQYTQYGVVWDKQINEGSYVGYLSFGSNVLKYSKDGASYLDSQGKKCG